MILNDLFDYYIEYNELLLSKSTLRSDLYTYNKHFKNSLGLYEVEKITFLDVQRYCNALLKQEYKVKTVKNILAKLRVIISFGVKVGLTCKNPCDLVELPKFDNKRYFDYPLKIQKRIILSIINNTGFNADIYFFLLHGRRKNEVLSLKWTDVNLKTRKYTIPYTINKAKRDMTYVMSDELFQRLYKRYIQAKKDKQLNNYVFVNPVTNTKFTDLRRSWNSLLKRNNLPKIRLHDIRHLVATYSINYLNLPIEQVSFTLGHTDIKTTQLYITNDAKKSKQTIEILINSVKDKSRII